MSNIDIFKFIMMLFITINPIGIIIPYLKLTEKESLENILSIRRSAILFAFSVLTVTIIIGHKILALLGLETYALQIAGGILFFYFGWQMLQGSDMFHNIENPGLVPLGFPLIAGPGTITAIIVYSYSLTQITLSSYLLMIFSVSLVLGFTYLLLVYAIQIKAKLGKNASEAIVKIFALLIVTLGIQLILSGISVWIRLNMISY